MSKSISYFPLLTPVEFKFNDNPDPTIKLVELKPELNKLVIAVPVKVPLVMAFPVHVKDPAVIFPAPVEAFGLVRLTPEELAVKEVVPELTTTPAQVIPLVIPNVLNVPDAVESKSNSYLPQFAPDDFNDNSNPDPTTNLLGLY